MNSSTVSFVHCYVLSQPFSCQCSSVLPFLPLSLHTFMHIHRIMLDIPPRRSPASSFTLHLYQDNIFLSFPFSPYDHTTCVKAFCFLLSMVLRHHIFHAQPHSRPVLSAAPHTHHQTSSYLPHRLTPVSIYRPH